MDLGYWVSDFYDSELLYLCRTLGRAEISLSHYDSDGIGSFISVEMPDSITWLMMNEKKRIFIIEDDEELRSLLKEFVEGEGYEADCEEKGAYAFRKLLTESFALIITDIRIPRFNRLDILLGLKKLQPETPVIVITAFGGEEVQRKAYEKGAAVYLKKPIDFHELRELIHKIIPLRKGNERGVANGRNSNCLPRELS